MGAQDCDYEPWFSESALVRLQLVFRMPPGARPELDDEHLTEQLSEVVRDWRLELRHAVLAEHGSSAASALGKRYRDAFTADYRERYAARVAAADIDAIEALSATAGDVDPVHFNLDVPFTGLTDDAVSLRIVHGGHTPSCRGSCRCSRTSDLP
ncbi:MAG: hypothetical protein CMD83_08050 [Gammaproteobacteria bacterium]|nr:hypothetical protein [Gammaproteobacteria bacterium]